MGQCLACLDDGKKQQRKETERKRPRAIKKSVMEGNSLSPLSLSLSLSLVSLSKSQKKVSIFLSLGVFFLWEVCMMCLFNYFYKIF